MIDGTPNNQTIDANRQQQVGWLYTKNYNFLQGCVQSHREIGPLAHELILDALAKLLPNYEGPPADDEAFKSWADEMLRYAAETIAEIMANVKAIRYGAKKFIEDDGCRDLGLEDHEAFWDTLNDIAHTGLLKIFDEDKLFKWIDPRRRRAKISTRLVGHGRSQALGWKKACIRNRDRKSDVDPEQCGFFGSRLYIEPAKLEDAA